MNKLYKDKKGFTLAELLLVVAIIGILMAVVFINVIHHQKALQLTEADNYAREIYVDVQNHLSDAKSTQDWQEYYNKFVSDSGTDTAVTASSAEAASAALGSTFDISTVRYALDASGVSTDDLINDSSTAADTGSTMKSHDFRRIVVNSETRQNTALQNTLNILLPAGTIDASVRENGSYVIEYDALQGTVFSVFYTKSDDFSQNDVTVLDNEQARLKQNKNKRMQYEPVNETDSKKYAVGYYGEGVTRDFNGGSSNSTNVEIWAQNDVRLLLHVNVTGSQSMTENELISSISSIYLKDGSTTVDLKNNYESRKIMQTSSVNMLDGTRTLQIVYCLDSVTEDYHVSDLFQNTSYQPGDNLTAAAETTDGKTYQSGSFNSLFANSSNTQEVNITNGRHLQNLNANVSCANGQKLRVKSVEIDQDIDWYSKDSNSDFFDSLDNEADTYFKIRHEGIASQASSVDFCSMDDQSNVKQYAFYSIPGNKITSIRSSSGSKKELSNFTIYQNPVNSDGCSGLISKISNTDQDLTVSSLALSNFTAAGSAGSTDGTYTAASGSAGALIGEFDGNNLTVSSVTVHNDNVYASTTAGGLIGQVDSTDGQEDYVFTKCGVAAGENGTIRTTCGDAGGLIGKIQAESSSSQHTVTMTDCYASAWVDAGANADGQGGDAGGLVGSIANGMPEVTVNRCYSLGRTENGGYSESQYNVTAEGTKSTGYSAGGLIGSIYDNSNNHGNNRRGTAVIQNSFSTCSVSAVNHDAGLVGYISAQSTTFQNCYCTGLVDHEKRSTNSSVFAWTERSTVSGSGNYYLAGINPSLDDGRVLVIDSSVNTSQSIVTAAKKGDSGKIFAADGSQADASPYDTALTDQYPYKTTGQLEGAAAEKIAAGDWPNAPEVQDKKLDIALSNGPRLLLKVWIPQDADPSDCRITVKQADRPSKQQVISIGNADSQKPIGSSDEKHPNTKEYIFILDSVVDGANKHLYSTASKIDAGANIYAEVQLGTATAKSETHNSLFADSDGSGQKSSTVTAYISNGRHLQNLSSKSETNGSKINTVTRAVILNNIDWSSSDSDSFASAIKTENNEYGFDHTVDQYYGIRTNSLQVLDGNDKTLSNFNISDSDNYQYAGIIGYYSGSRLSVSDLNIDDTTITQNQKTDAGALLGGTNDSSITISDVDVNDITIQAKYWERSGSCGGLIGAVSGGSLSINPSNDADDKVTISGINNLKVFEKNGNTAGGLVGQIDSASAVSIQNAEITGEMSVGGNQAGGLIGKVTDCTDGLKLADVAVSVSSLKVTAGQYAGGMIGYWNNAANQTLSISECRVVSGSSTVSQVRSSNADAGGLIGCLKNASAGASFSISNTGIRLGKAGIVQSDSQNDAGHTGGFIGAIENGYASGGEGTYSITDCYASVRVKSNHGDSGGFIGSIRNGNPSITINRCYATGRTDSGSYAGVNCDKNVESSNREYAAGGFVGSIMNNSDRNSGGQTTIKHSFTTCSVTNVRNENAAAGGFIGRYKKQGINIQKCYCTGRTYGNPKRTGTFFGFGEKESSKDKVTLSDSYYLVNTSMKGFKWIGTSTLNNGDGLYTDSSEDVLSYKEKGTTYTLQAVGKTIEDDGPFKVSQSRKAQSSHYDSTLSDRYPYQSVNQLAGVSDDSQSVVYGDYPMINYMDWEPFNKKQYETLYQLETTEGGGGAYLPPGSVVMDRFNNICLVFGNQNDYKIGYYDYNTQNPKEHFTYTIDPLTQFVDVYSDQTELVDSHTMYLVTPEDGFATTLTAGTIAKDGNAFYVLKETMNYNKYWRVHPSRDGNWARID